MATTVDAIEVDFDTFDDLDRFDVHSGSFIGVLQGSNAGVGNSGGLSPASKVELTFNETGFDLSEPVTVSTYFKTSSGNGVFASPYEMASVYVTSSLDGRPSVSTYASVGVELERDFAANTDVVNAFIHIPGQIWPILSTELGYKLPPNTWYELSLTLTREADVLRQAVTIYNHGSTGLTQPGSLVDSFSSGYSDESVISNDSTLFAGFGARNGLVSGLDNFRLEASGITPPTETVTITPTFDAQRVASSNYPLGALNQTTLDIDGGSGTSFPPLEVLTEFPLDQIPANAEIVNAQLVLDATTSSSGIVIQAMGYEGDGLASLSDPGDSLTEFGREYGPFTSDSDIYIDLDPTKIQTLLGEASHVGFLLKSQAAGPYIRIASNESTTGIGPRLVLEYSVVAAPLPGDYNDDGVVDAADYTVWRDAEGGDVPSGTGADGNDDGKIDQDDYDIWAAHYGTVSDPVQSESVPEPNAMALAFLASVIASYRYR
ncbi:hypothetical protein [Botrimarina colliarenosi]|nr:hypothetical protein [Botrimarina colliarenosi]